MLANLKNLKKAMAATIAIAFILTSFTTSVTAGPINGTVDTDAKAGVVAGAIVKSLCLSRRNRFSGE
ncbi:hypothetical protein NLJ89_g9925 [Agrocybe chaxingu]|uniref:Uncharacterized protein n=1 Tax=Agrocybe chaxingu TaxID=84603 RepID=A0A9W8MQR6_9AGAR|nr:hypothetical protein NLJ89_g9925 [Agrocybe chaxingu]